MMIDFTFSNDWRRSDGVATFTMSSVEFTVPNRGTSLQAQAFPCHDNYSGVHITRGGCLLACDLSMLGATMAVIRGLCTAEVGKGLSHRSSLTPNHAYNQACLAVGIHENRFFECINHKLCGIPPAWRLINEKQTFWLPRNFSCMLYRVG